MNDLILSEADALLLDKQLRPIPPASPFPYLLFHTLTGCFPFVKIEEDLARINDYLCTCETHLQNQLKQYRTQQKPPAEDEDLLGEDPTYDLTWMIETLNRENAILLLLSFLEGSLKDLAETLEEGAGVTVTAEKSRLSRIEQWIKRIEAVCGYDLICTLQHPLALLSRVRKIRNFVVHEWDCYIDEKKRLILSSDLKSFSLSELVSACSWILYLCEQAGMQSGWFPLSHDPVTRFLNGERLRRIENQPCDSEDLPLQRILLQQMPLPALR